MSQLAGRIIVVTGASSGIGRATAEQLLDAGATVIGVARGRETLEQVASEVADRPGRFEVADLDVTDGAAVDELVERTVAGHGRVDGWVNVAGISTYGRFEELPAEEFARVIEVNLLGSANGARAVLPRFREQGHGVLVNVASVLGRFGTPLMSPYVASKFAVRGWSESLRMELQDEPGVAVCTVLPGSVDTPLFQHAGDHTGERIDAPIAPMDPHRVAAAIVDVLENPRREVVVGHSSRLIFLARTVAPGLTERFLATVLTRMHTSGEPAQDTSGNLDESLADGEVAGGWRKVPVPSAVRLVRGAGAVAAAAALAGAAAVSERLRG